MDLAGFIKCCKNCQDRVVGCHATCKKYIEEKKAVEIQKKKEKEWLDKHKGDAKARSRIRSIDRNRRGR